MRLHPLQMRLTVLVELSVFIALSLMLPAQADNPTQTQQLLATRQCADCDLSNAGLVYADLHGADLRRANLSQANLSRANLAGADLQGAVLAGASLSGANLTGANLDGANLTSTDLRYAYLTNATLQGASLERVQLQGAIGLSSHVGSPEAFYQWAMADAEQKNYASAVENFTQVLVRKPDFAPAYLGRGLARLQVSDRVGAIVDLKQADNLFTAQGDIKTALSIQQSVKTLETPPEQPKSGNGFGIHLLSAFATLLQFFLP